MNKLFEVRSLRSSAVLVFGCSSPQVWTLLPRACSSSVVVARGIY